VTDTPLSDTMTAHVESRSPESFDRFLHRFRDSVIGVVAVGTAGQDAHGNPVADGNLSVGNTTHGDGKSRILCFADPDVAARVPGTPMNAGIAGHVLLRMAADDPRSAGILVNCATSQVSLVISRAAAQGALAEGHQPPSGYTP
jgi:hypothetical protein